MVQIQGYSQLQAGLTLLPFTILMIFIARLAGSLVDKYGPRWLLILGPVTAGLGFLFLSFVKQTSGPNAYWLTFFPGILCFGLGMSFTVAPLTTTVMGALPNHYSGTASGINNAITRIASVFANAILGALAVLFFTGYLNNAIKKIPLKTESRVQVIAQAASLGDAKVPAIVGNENKVKVQQVFKDGFISGYVKVMRVCAVLAGIGALMTFLFIKNEELKKDDG
jgi:MFS family permease